MIRPEHPFDIRPDLRKAASTEAASVIRPNQLVRRNLGLILSLKNVTYGSILLYKNIFFYIKHS